MPREIGLGLGRLAALRAHCTATRARRTAGVLILQRHVVLTLGASVCAGGLLAERCSVPGWRVATSTAAYGVRMAGFSPVQPAVHAASMHMYLTHPGLLGTPPKSRQPEVTAQRLLPLDLHVLIV